MFGSFLVALALALLQPEPADPPPRPVELLQARSCQSSAANAFIAAAPGQDEPLRGPDAVPDCMAPIFASLGAEALSLAGSDDATVVVQVGVGRAFNSTTMLYSAAADAKVHYVEELGPISDILAFEWGDYGSPDGDLGWSGFILVVDARQTRVRFLTTPASPFEAYETGRRLEAEFFPGKSVEISDTGGVSRD